MEGFYNLKRRYFELKMMSPVHFEERWRTEAA
jgi:hypothetical protein